jgi:hypothetical protein
VEVDRDREVIGVADAAGLALDAHDRAVEPFGHAVADRVQNSVEARPLKDGRCGCLPDSYSQGHRHDEGT